MSQQPQAGGRMYRDLAERLIADIATGVYRLGERLPGERDLATRHGVSRGTVREAIIVLEVLGVVEVRMGSGTHVLRQEGSDQAQPEMSAFEVTEALLMIEGEAAALAARTVEPSELSEMAGLIQRLERRDLRREGAKALHRDFHLAVARASRNQAVHDMVERLWEWRLASIQQSSGPERMQTAGLLIAECDAVLDALRAADPEAARRAMRTHLSAALDWLLVRAEEKAVTAARRATAIRRARYSPKTIRWAESPD